MRVKNLFLVLLFLVAASRTQASSCFPVMVPPASSEAATSEPKSTNLNILEMDVAREDVILEILNMFGQLRDHKNGYSEKKGEFVLGRRLPDSYSLELTYSMDGRGEAEIYNLSTLDLIHPDGYKENLSKRPVINNKFARPSYQFNGPLGEFDIRVPIRFEGLLLKEMLKWGNRLEYLEATRLRNVSKMSDLRFLYFKYLTGDQKFLFSSRARKEYSKILFNVATYAAIAYFTLNRASGPTETKDHSELFLLLLNFKGERVQGLVNTLALIERLEKDGPPILSKEFIDPEPRPGQSRVITVSEYTDAIAIVEMTYVQGQATDATALLVKKEDKIFSVLARSLREK